MLIARIEAVLSAAAATAPRRRPTAPARCGDIELDEAAHRVWRGGELVALSPTEYRLLRYLLLNPGIVVSKAQILEHVWQYDFGGDASVVETYMSTLRRKVDRHEPRLIHTVRGLRLRHARRGAGVRLHRFSSRQRDHGPLGHRPRRGGCIGSWLTWQCASKRELPDHIDDRLEPGHRDGCAARVPRTPACWSS